MDRPEENDRLSAEAKWLAGETEWWPDSLPLRGAKHHGMIPGDPSSEMPTLARERVDALRRQGKPYVAHISPGVHAYRIGFCHEYQREVP